MLVRKLFLIMIVHLHFVGPCKPLFVLVMIHLDAHCDEYDKWKMTLGFLKIFWKTWRFVAIGIRNEEAQGKEIIYADSLNLITDLQFRENSLRRSINWRRLSLNLTRKSLATSIAGDSFLRHCRHNGATALYGVFRVARVAACNFKLVKGQKCTNTPHQS